MLVDVRRVVDETAAAHERVYEGEPLLILISPLRDGVEAIAGEEARAVGYTVQGVETTSGTPIDGASAAATGRTVLRHADLVVAVWDGTSATDLEHAADVVAQTREWQIPMVLIDPRTPTAWHLETGGEPTGVATARDARLASVVRAVLTPPPPATDGRHPRDGLRQYLSTRPAGGIGGLFASAVRLIAWERPYWPRFVTLGPSVDRARADWTQLWTQPTPVDPAIADPVTHALTEYYVWADGLANRFATLHRDMSTTPYLLALLSALVAANVGDAAERIAPVIVTWLVFLLYWHSVRAKYHARWIDYRSLAEQLRQLAFLWPLGRPLRALRIRGEGSTEVPQFAWVEWYARAVARSLGLFPGVFTAERLAACRELLLDRFIRPQCSYHDRTARRLQTVQKRLHTVALALFWATLILATVRAVLPPAHQPRLGLVAAIFLPALAAGVHGFLSLGDFSNLARRSKRMHDELLPLTERPVPPHETLERLGDVGEEAADAMGDELLNWRVFVRLKGPSLG